MVGGSRRTRREPTQTRGEHANSTQKGPRWGSNLDPSRCEATVLTTTPPCSPLIEHRCRENYTKQICEYLKRKEKRKSKQARNDPTSAERLSKARLEIPQVWCYNMA